MSEHFGKLKLIFLSLSPAYSPFLLHELSQISTFLALDVANTPLLLIVPPSPLHPLGLLLSQGTLLYRTKTYSVESTHDENNRMTVAFVAGLVATDASKFGIEYAPLSSNSFRVFTCLEDQDSIGVMHRPSEHN